MQKVIPGAMMMMGMCMGMAMCSTSYALLQDL